MPSDWSIRDIKPPLWSRADEPYTDPWGCRWETSEDGIMGITTFHPLSDWSAFKGFKSPDPEATNGAFPLDWKEIEESWKKPENENALKGGGLPHGFFLLRLADLRGFQNLMIDLLDEPPELLKLIDMVEEFNKSVVSRFVNMGAEIVSFGEDLGTQTSSIISPALFRKYVKPVYKRLFSEASRKGAVVYLHSDGYLLDIVDDLIETGINVLNPQDIVNGIDNIAKLMKGRVAIMLDIDRQNITRFGTPGDIDSHIREAVAKLASPEGGFGMGYGLYPGIPLENVEAVMTAMEKYSGIA